MSHTAQTSKTIAYGEKIRQLIQAGQFLHEKGWVPATSGNFSARLSDREAVITASGRHKGHLREQDFLIVNSRGEAVGSEQKPSAETLLHTTLYQRFADIGSVLHTHSINATLLSRMSQGELCFEDYELLKAFEGIQTHESRLVVPIFDNDQDITRLSAKVDDYIDNHPSLHGYLIAGHGLYTWGRTAADSLRHIEAFEFLFQCELTLRGIPSV